MELTSVPAAKFLQRSVNFSGVRLFETAFEQTQAAAEPGPGAILALQLAENIFEEPWRASRGLLGIRDPQFAQQ
jgi:hypothetical protein